MIQSFPSIAGLCGNWFCLLISRRCAGLAQFPTRGEEKRISHFKHNNSQINSKIILIKKVITLKKVNLTYLSHCVGVCFQNSSPDSALITWMIFRCNLNLFSKTQRFCLLQDMGLPLRSSRFCSAGLDRPVFSRNDLQTGSFRAWRLGLPPSLTVVILPFVANDSDSKLSDVNRFDSKLIVRKSFDESSK